MNSEQLIKSLLKQGEGEQLEFKQVIRKDAIGKSICAFLNHEGGQVLVGVSDDNKVVGINDAERWEKELTEYLNTAIIPEAPVMVSLEQVGSKQVILVKVWAGSKQPYIFDGSIYFRRGQSTVKATSQEISDLIHNRQKTELHWERQIALGVELEDLDIHEIQTTITRSINESKLDESKGNPIDFLTHFGLFQNGHFTNAALVLFAKNPARFIPQARVRVAFLEKGKTANEFVDDKLLDGNLFKNITAVQDFFEKHLRTSRKFSEKEWERQDEYVVPMSALREGVMNALVHRDYSVPSASMSVIIYSDKIEIFNSGKSPLKAAELKKSHLSLPVNPDIAHMAFLRGYIEKIGRGTIKIMDACKTAGLKAPKWTTSESSVKLSFPLNVKLGGATDGANGGASNDTLTTKLDGAIDGAIDGATKATKRKLSVLLKAIVSNEGKRTPDYKGITKLGSGRTMERYIEQLKEVGFIEFKGTAAQTGGYFITDKLKKIISS
ncbi:RNA-binding domain-containing protein [Sunxiuqinia dokdonensis]|uniref:Transcriptional regulator n=1 Tax=Sunxiuqinia dokdonensis TaxID=1409788 RepID=A0A0L8V2L8_9BACT|nr:RNA-binding domain-containing protein [Sunxiuqinia dokdonensis]KOH42629.1 transcriptional regulator [Sunxiuqinia dokdonensis]